ncbi:hypothetical protein QM480_01240 [Flectobacillus sp. DC10W]|uniref:Lipoprotein n=1 Tax=Flectobacillus longus TaxID=2984207 RepID=A0ABT6YIE4_9BACT|nr:hypothetical protein [Flectobacillus longus]MDI9862931.1 hypothetical protein [Flectobacillus longus]
MSTLLQQLMKKISLILALMSLVILLNACNQIFKCDGIACVSPPPIPRFKILNSSGINVSDSTGYFLKIANDNSSYRGTMVKTPEATLYWDIMFTKGVDGTKEYELYAENTKLGVIRYEISMKKSGCCSNYSIDVLNLNNISFLNSQDQYGKYTIKLK